ncbi:Hypothetical protein SMAX5B_004945 [Scophthalmus maximus]|uniref:Uncharacterized protein n=1 Tax=Scophthalmus maximus TaxID=52904 RepID=A0A2U9BS66_SCOMX|nr:Hypothetical protein SMAX5B_004945 [Scophthalmus maximus]
MRAQVPERCRASALEKLYSKLYMKKSRTWRLSATDQSTETKRSPSTAREAGQQRTRF